MGTPTPMGAGVEARLPRKAMGVLEDTMGILGVAMDDPEVAMGVSVDGASVEALPRVSRGGEASNGASPCESRGKARGVPGWWS